MHAVLPEMIDRLNADISTIYGDYLKTLMTPIPKHLAIVFGQKRYFMAIRTLEMMIIPSFISVSV
jgi:hypothetical protein